MTSGPGRRPLPTAAALAALLLSGPAAAQAAPGPTATPKSAATRPQAHPSAGDQPGPSDGSSLGEIVRKSKEEKAGADGKKKRSLGTITNESLKKDGGPAPGTASSGKKGSGTLTVLPKGSMPAPLVPVEQPGFRDQKGRSEQEWKNLLAGNRAETEKAEAAVKRLDLEVKRLENDFYAWSDGNYRDRVIRPNWDKAREDLKKARTDLDAALGRRADLEEEARKSGTPPGWLREQ
jgi:hypothetical protein